METATLEEFHDKNWYLVCVESHSDEAQDMGVF